MLSSQDLLFFGVVASTRSLAAAARSLDITPSAASQRLQHLERKLGIRLADRTSQRLNLTAEGLLLAERGGDVMRQIEEIASSLLERREIVSGPLRVVAPFGFGRAHVADAMAEMRRRHPLVDIVLTLSDDPACSVRTDQWDVLVHVGALADSAFALRRLAPNRRVLCAAPAYLAEHGHPVHPGDLARHVCGVIRENQDDVTLWGFASAEGTTTTVRVKPALVSNDGSVVKRWACAGLGIINRSEWDVADDLQTGRLVEMLPGWRLPDADVVALLGPREGRAARMERFVELLTLSLSPTPWRRTSEEI